MNVETLALIALVILVATMAFPTAVGDLMDRASGLRRGVRADRQRGGYGTRCHANAYNPGTELRNVRTSPGHRNFGIPRHGLADVLQGEHPGLVGKHILGDH